MTLDAQLLEVLACPSCRAQLRLAPSSAPKGGPEGDLDRGPELACTACELSYPVVNGIPVLLIERARRPVER
jgi:hypothetical protein